MSKLKFLGVVLICAVILIGAYVTWQSNTATASVNVANEYHSTSSATWGSSKHYMVNSGAKVLGSITVGSTTLGYIKIWDSASSTNSSTTDSTNASSSPVYLGSLPANGTYTFDIVLYHGLVVETGAVFNGAYTITYR